VIPISVRSPKCTLRACSTFVEPRIDLRLLVDRHGPGRATRPGGLGSLPCACSFSSPALPPSRPPAPRCDERGGGCSRLSCNDEDDFSCQRAASRVGRAGASQPAPRLGHPPGEEASNTGGAGPMNRTKSWRPPIPGGGRPWTRDYVGLNK